MRIGISLTSSHPDVDPRTGAARMIERARAARLAGLDSLFVGDHHVTRTNYFQNSPMLGRLLAEWGDAPAGALYLLPLWHPVLLAEQVATLAAIAGGRFIVQCGLGWEPHQSAGMGVDFSRRVAMFETSLAALRALWNGETITLDAHWPLQDARIAPTPPAPVEVWIAAQAPVAIERAARLGDGWLAAPDLVPAAAAAAIATYREACARHDCRPAATAIRRDVLVGASAADARRRVEACIGRGYRGFSPEALVYGSIDQVADQFRRLAELGYSEVVVRSLSPHQDESLATIERLADVRQLLA